MYRKNSKFLYILLASFFVSLFAACERELDVPPIDSLDPNLIPNTSIADLKKLYDGSEDFVTIEDDIIIGALVTANDHSGNFYRQIIISDDSGGIELKIHDNNLYERYPLGQKLYIRVKDLILGSYEGLIQLGGTIYDAGGLRLGGIEREKVSDHVFRIPGGKVPEAVLITLGGNLDDHIHTMVLLENVQFITANLGMPFANPNQTTNRDITDCDGNTIILRTSSFADFSSYIVPEGNGTIKAILTKFREDYQLVINEYEDLDMSGSRCDIGGTPEGNGSFEFPFNVAAAISNNEGTGVWVQGYIVGVRERESNDDPFENNFNAPFIFNSNIILADSPDETSSSNLLMVQLPIGDVRDAINLVDNPEKLGENVKLRGDLEAYFGLPGMLRTSHYWMEGMPDPDLDPDPVTFIDEDFQSYANHSIINNYGWTAYAETGSRNWICRTHQGNHYAQATAYGSNDATNNMWMITPPINLDAMTNPTFEFESAKAFYTHDGFSLHIATNFDGVNVTDADWQTLDAVLAGEGDADHEWIHSGFLDLSSYSGIVHIAWKYVSAAPQGNTGTFRVDNVKLYEAD